ncbi:MAG: integrase [Rickettsiales bacterium]|nr:integrase [Rickettsiales bacterium]
MKKDHNLDDFSMIAQLSKPIQGEMELDKTLTPRIEIPWRELIQQRGLALTTIDDMPMYLLKPEIKAIIQEESKTEYRLALELLWNTGARISELLALTPASFTTLGGRKLHVILTTLKQRGRPKKQSLLRSKQRTVPILDPILKQKISDYIQSRGIKRSETIFPFGRHILNIRLKKITANMDNAVYSVSCKTFRHSFAVHLVLHGCPLKYISMLLGHSNVKTTEIYTRILTIDGSHFLEGIHFS